MRHDENMGFADFFRGVFELNILESISYNNNRSLVNGMIEAFISYKLTFASANEGRPTAILTKMLKSGKG